MRSAPGFLAVGLVAMLTCSAGAAITTDPPVPVEGETATIRVTGEADAPVAGAAVQAVYRPGSNVERAVEVGTTGADGTVAWTPDGAGLVALTAGEGDAAQSKNLSVRFRGLPLSGLIILLGAGIVLYGGIIRGFRSLTSLPPQLPPDT